MMDAPVTRAVEAYVHAGFPTDAAAVLIVELDGLPGAVGGRGRPGAARSAGPTAPARSAWPRTRPSGR